MLYDRRDFYKILGVPKNANTNQIKKAYMDRNKELNKDKLLIHKPGFYVSMI